MTNSPWPEGKQIAVSLTFDDARPSQLTAAPIFARHGIKATFHVTAKNVDPHLQEWQAMQAAGHEISNHSVKHSCSGNFNWNARNVLENYTLEEMEAELLEANALLAERFGTTPDTFAYPCGQTFVGRGVNRQSYVPVVARNFLAGRGFRDEYLNRPDFVDLAKVGGTEMDDVDFDSMMQSVERARKEGAWLVFVGHDILTDEEKPRQKVQPETLERLCAYCADPQNGIWIETFSRIARAVRDYQEAR